jgi:hypothetical protein
MSATNPAKSNILTKFIVEKRKKKIPDFMTV